MGVAIEAKPSARMPEPHDGLWQANAPTFTLALAGLAFCIATNLSTLFAVWSTGLFLDTDDALRMTQLRDLLEGQAWSDLTQSRMNAPDGLPMHWSRVIDAPLAALISFLEPLSTRSVAERLTRILWPAALHLGYFVALIHAARSLNAGRGAMAAILLGLGMIATNQQFLPGRIDHHGAQILLLMAMTGAALTSLAPGRAGAAATAGALAALSLSISVENVPFIAALGGGLTLLLAAEPERGASPALFFALALCGAAFPLLLATTPPASLFKAACDAFSIFHVSAAAAGAAAIVILALLSRGLQHTAARLGFAAGVGGVAFVLLHRAYPACFGDPLAVVDPLLRALWLDNVAEARPLVALTMKRPDMGLPLAAPILLGLAAAGAAAWRSDPAERGRWLLVSLLIGAGFAATLWQVRAASSTLPLVVLPAVWLLLGARARVAGRRPLMQVAPFAAVLPFTSLFWMAVIPEPKRESRGAPAACMAPEGLAPLAALRPGIVLSSVDAGSHILAHTGHSVLAGPYHRNNQGNLVAVHALLATPLRARAMALASGAELVAVCTQMVDLAIYAEQAPDSLAALLKRGEAPDWLAPVESGPSHWKIYRIR